MQQRRRWQVPIRPALPQGAAAPPTLTPLRVITSDGLPRMSRASVPCTAKSAITTQLRASSHHASKSSRDMPLCKGQERARGNTADGLGVLP